MAFSRELFRAAASFPVYLSLFYLLNLNFVHSKCQKSFQCGNLGRLGFPLSNFTQPECGLFRVQCDSTPHPLVYLEYEGILSAREILSKISAHELRIRNPSLEGLLKSKSCALFNNFSIQSSPSISFSVLTNITLFKCHKTPIPSFPVYYRKYTGCDYFDIYYAIKNKSISCPDECSVFHLPGELKNESDSTDLFDQLSPEYNLQWFLSVDCAVCHNKGGQCTYTRKNEFICENGAQKKILKLILAIVIPGSIVILCVVGFFVWRHKRRINDAYLLSRKVSSDPSSKSDIEDRSLYFGIPIFSYTELEVATHNFDSSNELGDGGFGTVYYGKLRDGREVAIKRLHEHNYKRVEQFMNEIKILTCLRHRNLVSLYGCTSRLSRELLLVYEYVSNGTVADHIHGDRANEAQLSWPIRMNIAIETASALAYLHASDIIHRDVKTNNILLDNNFCVKVADFGLSRLFPNDVTHISTAPQGTPGYVDPEYHQYYQLTNRSDVYSFGVVLVELISSMPAVDISRHSHEINLANLAISRIQRCAFNELIDPSLGFGYDTEVTRMTTSVAEIAFQCLQLQKELRPSMDEVLAFLKEIRGDEEFEIEKKMETNDSYSVPRSVKIPPSPEIEDVVLLKSMYIQSSPNAVTDMWISGSSTTSSSV